MPVSPNEIFGHYKIISRIGAGGMGEVFLAQDTRLERKVALKILGEEFTKNPDRMNRFIQEAKAASSLNHPNIIVIHEIGEQDGTHFIATEYIEGETLRTRLAHQPLKMEEILDIAIQIANALTVTHQAGIVHRDIKPENIMLRPDGYVKVLDFGLAKLTERRDSAIKEDSIKKLVETSPGIVMGTPNYMSPEQARGLDVDERADIWSVGILLFEMATCHVPFAGNTISDIIASVLKSNPPAMSTLIAGCPAEFERIVHKTLQKDREARYQAVRVLALDLKSLQRRLTFEEELKRDQSFDKTEEFGAFTSANLSKQTLLTDSNINKDALLITEFINQTGESIFDATLKMALAVSLEQSPYLDIFADTRVQRTLQLMGYAPNEKVTRELGREICLRQGLKAYIAGTIANLGTLYVLTLEAVNAQTGETLGRQFEQAESKEQVLKALGQAASGLREKLGESLSSIEKFDAPLEATTTSLEALKVYTLAHERARQGKYIEAIPFYRRAIEFDPNFATAYTGLGAIYHNTNQPQMAAEVLTKAFTFKDKVSELEKLRISYYYYSIVTGELDKAIESLDLMKRTYPLLYFAPVALSDSYLRIGNFEKAVAEATDAMRLNPNVAVNFWNLGEPLLNLNRFDEAKAIFQKSFEQQLDTSHIHIFQYEIAFIEENVEEMQKHLTWLQNQPDEYVAINLQTKTAAFRGQWRKAQEFSKRAIDLAARSEAQGVAAQFAVEQALRIAFWSSGSGLPDPNSNQLRSALKTQTQKALTLEKNKFTLPRTALVFSLAGQIMESQNLINELKAQFPKDTLINYLWLPTIKGALELQQGKINEAIDCLKTAKRYESAAEFYPQYIRGLAFLKSNNLSNAVTEFDKILTRRGESLLSEIYPLAQLGKARATKNKSDYEKFFELWKDADADMPLLVAAKQEFEKL
jgi:serine/threonine protein kinase/tetratricopeptide (TPR) repeat protein